MGGGGEPTGVAIEARQRLSTGVFSALSATPGASEHILQKSVRLLNPDAMQAIVADLEQTGVVRREATPQRSHALGLLTAPTPSPGALYPMLLPQVHHTGAFAGAFTMSATQPI